MPLEMPEDLARPWLRRAICTALGVAPPANEDVVEAALAWTRAPGNHLLVLDDRRYPQLLREIPDPPPALFARGRLELLQQEAIAIVGSRNATPRGMQDARDFARGLSHRGICVVSGLARGIDAAAHAGGLEGTGSSIAVLGTGPERIYPSGNAALARELAARGCIITEFPPGTSPLPRNFPQRNRIISGLARGVLVVEAAQKSGSLVTAHRAAEQGREVFALPGSIHATLSKGCHELIREGAKLVEELAQVIEELPQWRGRGPEAGPVAAPAALEGGRHATPRDRILAAMGFAPVSLDAVARLAGVDAASAAARLARLELDGRVARLDGGLYQRSR